VWTPIAKGWITARARWVASEAMNVRAGNGYTEEWPNARLLRDSYLGAIWEGTTNIVALDVQRAILKDGAFVPLAGLIGRRLETVGEPAAKPGADFVRTALAEIAERTLAWPGLPKAERELDARPVADGLYHALAASLLLAEGQALRDRTGDCRKFLAALLYIRRWLRPPTPLTPPFPSAALGWLDALTDWTPAPVEALSGAA
jgi:acyl-CoA dehydrogenase